MSWAWRLGPSRFLARRARLGRPRLLRDARVRRLSQTSCRTGLLPRMRWGGRAAAIAVQGKLPARSAFRSAQHIDRPPAATKLRAMQRRGGGHAAAPGRRRRPEPGDLRGSAVARLLHPGEGRGLAEHRGDAARQVDRVLALDREGARIALAVRPVVERARPLVGAGLLGALHDDEADDRAVSLGGIGVLVVGLLPIGRP